MNKNKESTRYYSDLQENAVSKNLCGRKISNSGAGTFNKLDVIIDRAHLGIECKTLMEDKNSFSIKKEWIDKNKEEAFAMRLDNSCIAFNFGPDQPNYYVINEKLMKFIIDKLEGEYDNET